MIERTSIWPRPRVRKGIFAAMLLVLAAPIIGCSNSETHNQSSQVLAPRTQSDSTLKSAATARTPEFAADAKQPDSRPATAVTPALLVAPFNKSAATAARRAWVEWLNSEAARDESVRITATDNVTNFIGMELVLIPAGKFQMGSTKEHADLVAKFDVNKDYDLTDEQPLHRVRITRPLYVGKYEVTRRQFAEFVKSEMYRTEAETDGKGGWGWDEEEGDFMGPRPEFNWRNTGLASDDSHPVVNVTWKDAVAFCKWLSKNDELYYRLPTEAEWEYACRAGTTTLFAHGDDPESVVVMGNIADASAKERFPGWTTVSARDGHVTSAPVGSFKPNVFGLYDMHGNVWEWCADRYGADYYAIAPVDDPLGPIRGSHRVRRGGGWDYAAGNCRSAYRNGVPPEYRINYLGFRVVASPFGT